MRTVCFSLGSRLWGLCVERLQCTRNKRYILQKYGDLVAKERHARISHFMTLKLLASDRELTEEEIFHHCFSPNSKYSRQNREQDEDIKKQDVER